MGIVNKHSNALVTCGSIDLDFHEEPLSQAMCIHRSICHLLPIHLLRASLPHPGGNSHILHYSAHARAYWHRRSTHSTNRSSLQSMSVLSDVTRLVTVETSSSDSSQQSHASHPEQQTAPFRSQTHHDDSEAIETDQSSDYARDPQGSLPHDGTCPSEVPVPTESMQGRRDCAPGRKGGST